MNNTKNAAPSVIAFMLLLTAVMADPRESRTLDEADNDGTKWAVLVAGSYGYRNFRHQADVCHAYQILKQNGMKDENIIVFMYDDIAESGSNPTPGIIINQPGGSDVYAGVPKDYTGDSATAANLYAVLLGDTTALSGGSGKVLGSGQNDNVFIYYADHGSPGLLTMPVGNNVYANDFIDVLKKMWENQSYKNLVIYVEACEAGSMFDGLLPSDMNIYVTTASNPYESSYGYYCPGQSRDPDVEKYGTCLGDLYSISWMEDCDAKDLRSVTLQQQYDVVKERTTLSHVMQYGYTDMASDFLSSYMGDNPRSLSSQKDSIRADASSSPATSRFTVRQRDADLLYYQHKAKKAERGTAESIEAQKRLSAEISKREKDDSNIHTIVKILSVDAKTPSAFKVVRPAGHALVDDWDCFKSLVRTYEQRCGRMSTYGRKYTGVIANLCNAGVKKEKFDVAALQACSVAP